MAKKFPWILVIVLAGVLLWQIKKRPAEVPVIRGVTTIHDTIAVHDTVRIYKKRDDFKVVTRPAAVESTIHAAVDTAQVAAVTTSDLVHFYQVEQSFEDGANIKIEMGSKEFPAVRPVDLSGYIDYLPPPTAIQIETRVDSVPKLIYKPPILPTWQAVALGVAAGVVATVVVIKK